MGDLTTGGGVRQHAARRSARRYVEVREDAEGNGQQVIGGETGDGTTGGGASVGGADAMQGVCGMLACLVSRRTFTKQTVLAI